MLWQAEMYVSKWSPDRLASELHTGRAFYMGENKWQPTIKQQINRHKKKKQEKKKTNKSTANR